MASVSIDSERYTGRTRDYLVEKLGTEDEEKHAHALAKLWIEGRLRFRDAAELEAEGVQFERIENNVVTLIGKETTDK